MVQQIFYHVLIDSDFYMLNTLYTKPFKFNFAIFGNLRDTIEKKMPIVFELDDAKHVAKRLITTIKENGSSINSCKSYPVFGAIIIKMSLDIYDIKELGKLQHDENGMRLYEELNNFDTKFLTYAVRNKDDREVKRGILNRSEFSNITLLSAQYVNNDETSNLGWAILNSYKNLTSNDIRTLKYIFDMKKEVMIEHTANGVQITDKLYLEKKNNISSIISNMTGENFNIQMGGSMDDTETMRKKLHDVKKKYLEMKKQPQMGGSMDDTETMRKKLHDVKKKYLEMKK